MSEINAYIYLAQAASNVGIASTLAAIAAGMFAGIYCGIASSEAAEFVPAPRAVIRFMFISFAIAVLAGFVPSRETLIYSIGIEKGPEYIERLLSVAEDNAND